MLQSTTGISPQDGELVAMGGPCRTVVGKGAGHNTSIKDLPPVDERAASKSLTLYRKPVELYSLIRSRLEKRVLNLISRFSWHHEPPVLVFFRIIKSYYSLTHAYYLEDALLLPLLFLLGILMS